MYLVLLLLELSLQAIAVGFDLVLGLVLGALDLQATHWNMRWIGSVYDVQLGWMEGNIQDNAGAVLEGEKQSREMIVLLRAFSMIC